MMTTSENKAIKFLTKCDMLNDTSKVYVATSGGADSMALLCFMHKYRETFGIEVGAIHVNHGIRGESANNDADFVRHYCESNKIEFILCDATSDGVKVPKQASEDWARQLRYNYFKSVIKKGVKVATAHTLSDQTETILFRLARGGSGLSGLSGIPAVRDGYIRPFLCLNRDEIEALVELYGTGNITDETNLGDEYSRNKIRHHVVPVLKEINSNAEVSFGKFCDRMTKAQQYIEKQARMLLLSGEQISGIKYSIDSFLNVDEIVLEEEILQLLSTVNAQSEANVEAIKEIIYRYKAEYRNEFRREVILGVHPISYVLSVMVTSRYVTLTRSREDICVDCGLGSNKFGPFSYDVHIEECDQASFKLNCKSKFDLCNYADAAKLDLSKCKLRSRREKDIFKPACKTKDGIGKFMKNIPVAERYAVPVLEYNGKIVWVWGVGFTDGFTPTEESTNILKLTWGK